MNKKLVFFLASALVIAGCQKQQPQEEVPVGAGTQDANFSLVASSDVFTKTQLNESNEILWKAGDKLSVWEKGSDNVNKPFELDAASADTKVGLFEGDLTPAEEFERLRCKSMCFDK